MQRKEWKFLFIEKFKGFHKKNLEKKADRMLRKIDGAKNGMKSRSKKYNIEFNINIEDLRQLALNSYGEPCKYTGRIMNIDNMVFDHIIPVSKGGKSVIENIQIISKFANNVKGSLDEKDFLLLLKWLETVSEELRRDILIRLAKGIH